MYSNCSKFCRIFFHSVDFRRALKTIDRVLLVKKLQEMGIGGTALERLRSYHTERKQKVVYQKATSEPLHVEIGVPQGTILGPLLFILYINDAEKCLARSKNKMFADDSMIYLDISEIITKVNADLEVYYKWLCDNKLSPNTSKTRYRVSEK